MKHQRDRLAARYRYWKRKQADGEKAFDRFMRAHRDDDAARKAYAEKANAEYFAIKAKLAAIREEYRSITTASTCDFQ